MSISTGCYSPKPSSGFVGRNSATRRPRHLAVEFDAGELSLGSRPRPPFAKRTAFNGKLNGGGLGSQTLSSVYFFIGVPRAMVGL